MGNPWDDAPPVPDKPWDSAPSAPPATVGREASILARGAYPVAAGATLGAGIGSLAGPAGTAMGGLVGGVSVPLAEGVSQLYNMGAKATGLPQVGSPTKAVQDLLTKMGLPEPKSTAERAVEAAGSALGSVGTSIPAAASLAVNAASPVTRGVGAAMAQQPAVQTITAPIAAGTNQAVTEKTGSPVLGFLSSLMVGGAPAMATGKVGGNAVRQDIKAEAQNYYQQMEQSGLNIDPKSFSDWVDSLPGKIKGWGKFAGNNAPTTQRLIDTARTVADSGEPVSIADLDQLHHVLGGSHSIANTDFDNASMMQMKSALNEYVSNLKADDLTGTVKPGSGPGAPADWHEWRTQNQAKIDDVNDALTQARDLWHANSKMRDIEQIVEVAPNQDDPDLYIRQQFRRITRNPDDFNNYTPNEKNLIVKIAKQGFLGQVGRASPHLTPAGMVKGAIIHGPVAAVLGPAGAGLTAAGTYGAFKGAQALRQARIQALQNTIAGVPNPSVLDNTALQTAPLTAARAVTSNPLGLGASRAQSQYLPPQPFVPDDDNTYARNP